MRSRRALIVGGSRGLGYGAARVLCCQGWTVTILARGKGTRKAEDSKADLIKGDAADRILADQLLGDLRPHAVIVTAGSPPAMAPIDRITWPEFETCWQADTRIALTWVQAALAADLPKGAQLILTGSGAGLDGSPRSGGYAGAKRMTIFLADYGEACAREMNRDLTIRSLSPRQMAPGTGTGEAGAAAYAKGAGVTKEEFFARFGAPLTPEFFGRAVAEMLDAPDKGSGVLTTRAGLEPLEVWPAKPAPKETTT